MTITAPQHPEPVPTGTSAPQPLAAELVAEATPPTHLPSLKRVEAKATGIFITTDAPLPVDTVITLNLKLADDLEVKTLARVSYVVDTQSAGAGRPAGMGLRFLEVWGNRKADEVSAALDEAANAARAEPKWMAGARVLVIDDDERYREATAKAMREAGFDVVTARNGLEGLSAALAQRPSVVLSDVTMPGMDGWQLLRLLRARPALRRTPVVFLTELTSDLERLRGYQLGVDDYLPKPFTAVELIARVERVLERANAAEEAVASGMCGDLSKVPLASLLSLVEMERRAGVLHLSGDEGSATLHLVNGAVVRIDLAPAHDNLKGLERFFHVLEWQSGRFEFSVTSVPVEDVMQLTTSHALLEHARQHDERLR